ncbi:MAG: DUF3847 domain-containing protein [Oscillospiraceae bacterium]|nr:DUF3847 domain-containing protein [Oscillospiraceae bacterium]
MTTTTKRTRAERIDARREQIKQMENEVKRLVNEEKEFQRKARTRRLCKRAGFLESILPDTITLSDDRFEKFVKEHIASKFGTSALRKLLAEQEHSDTKSDATQPTQAKTESPMKLQPSPHIEDDSFDDDDEQD